MKKIIFLSKYYLARIWLYLFVLPKRATGVEVGVYKGSNAKLLYYLSKPEFLWLIDSYNESKYTQAEIRKIIGSVKRWTLGKSAKLLIGTSEKFSKMISDEILDWIYIDGDHFNLHNDLTYWYDKVKPGGIIMGDDYCDTWWKVKFDLQVFCASRELEFKTLHCQWWIKK